MRTLLRKYLALACMTTAALIIAAPQHASAQSLNDLVEQLGIQQLARDYLRPGADAIGYTINSGYAHTAQIDTSFHLWIGVKGITTFIPPDQGSFVGKLPDVLVAAGYPAQVTTATVVGGSGSVLRSQTDPSQPEIVLPDGTGLKQVSLILPQVSFGPVLGTDIILRGLPPVTYDTEIGKVSFYGAALKHELTHFFDSPVDVALLAGYQSFDMSDAISGNSLNAMFIASRAFGMITVFGGLGYEAYGIDVSYTFTPEDPSVPQEDITLEFRRRNLRLSFGGAVTLLSLLELTGEYSIGEMDNLTIGMGLTF
jgi:hypothetical protein